MTKNTRKLIVGLCVTAVMGLGVLIYCLSKTSAINIPVTNKEWTREITIEKYDWVTRTDSRESTTSEYDIVGILMGDGRYPNVPSGARNVNRWIDTHSRTKTDNDGNSRKVDYYEYNIRYEIQEWTYSRTLKSSGGFNDEMKWPEFVSSDYYMERERNRSQNFVIYFLVNNKSKKYKSDKENIYNSIKVDRNYECQINGFGVITEVAVID